MIYIYAVWSMQRIMKDQDGSSNDRCSKNSNVCHKDAAHYDSSASQINSPNWSLEKMVWLIMANTG